MRQTAWAGLHRLAASGRFADGVFGPVWVTGPERLPCSAACAPGRARTGPPSTRPSPRGCGRDGPAGEAARVAGGAPASPLRPVQTEKTSRLEHVANIKSQLKRIKT